MKRSLSQNFITRNFAWKAASLGAAFALWWVFSGARDLTTSLSVPVQYRNIPKNLEISSEIAEQVHLILRGPSPLLSRLTSSQLPVVLDLGSIKNPGQATYTIDVRNVALPAGVALERAIPAQIRLRTEERLSMEVPVQAQFENVPPGMQVASTKIVPDHLTVVGPKSRVVRIATVETDALDLSDVKDKAEFKTTAYSGHAQVIFDSPPEVTVRVTLQRKQP